jgi:hypothetical protein
VFGVDIISALYSIKKNFPVEMVELVLKNAGHKTSILGLLLYSIAGMI